MIYRPHNDLVSCFDCVFHAFVVNPRLNPPKKNQRRTEKEPSHLQTYEPVHVHVVIVQRISVDQVKCACCQQFILIIRYIFIFPSTNNNRVYCYLFVLHFLLGVFAVPKIFIEFVIIKTFISV